MLALPITALFAAPLGLLLVALSLRVIHFRQTRAVSHGDDGSPEMRRAIRAHQNCVEHVPMTLLMLALLEGFGAPLGLSVAIGTMLLVGRLLHGFHFAVSPRPFFMRPVGMGLTLLSQVTAAFGLIWALFLV